MWLVPWTYGNEGDYFLVLLSSYLTSTITTTCCLSTCPSQVYTITSWSVVLPQPANIVNNVFLEAVDAWQYPPHSQCGRKFESQPPEGTSFNEDTTLDESGDAHMSWHCAGVRVSSPRTMLNLKSFIIFSVDLLSRGGLLQMSQTLPSISLFGRSFQLYGATLLNGGHYICVFHFKGGWYMYDGLKEYQRQDSGIPISSAMFSFASIRLSSYAVTTLSRTIGKKLFHLCI